MSAFRPIIWVSADKWIAWQTEAMAGHFGCSRPVPSNRRMGFIGGKRAPKTIVEKLGFDPARMMGVLFASGWVSIRPDACLPAEVCFRSSNKRRLSPAQRRSEISARLARGVPQTVICGQLGITRSTLWHDLQALRDCGSFQYAARRGRASWRANQPGNRP